MAFCPTCGWQHDGTARFCQKCGTPLAPDAVTATQPDPTAQADPQARTLAASSGAPEGQDWSSAEHDLWTGKTIDMATGGSWSPSHFRLTTRSLFFAHGRLGSVEKSVPLWAVREVTVARSLIDKARNVGDLVVKVEHGDWTEGTQEIRMDDIENPEQVRDLILRQAREESYNYERRDQTMFYQGRPPYPSGR
jgi:hypothetical protein